MASLAVVFGATSYYAGNQYLENQAQARLSEIGKASAAVDLSQVVVAKETLKFGDTLTEDKLKLVSWPKEAMPEGAFNSIEEILESGDRKVIKSMEANEPLLLSKVSGENGNGGLAGLISEGMRAVTIPVDLVKGVGGFVQPGDSVDIVFTQRDRETGAQTAKIIMEKVKVLSVDQQADTRTNIAKEVKSVTLETDAAGAQKLALASEVGRLSLLLRSAGDDSSTEGKIVSFDEIDPNPKSQSRSAAEAVADGGEAEAEGFLSSLLKGQEKISTEVRVVVGEKSKVQTVPVQEILARKIAKESAE